MEIDPIESTDFLSDVCGWISRDVLVEAAALFGSSVNAVINKIPIGDADLDLHVVSEHPELLERTDWTKVLPNQGYCFSVVRPATGGVRKVTALFANGAIDLVVVPVTQLRESMDGMNAGLHLNSVTLRTALNELATCLRTGYFFLKGHDLWGSFYARVEREMPGVRISNDEARQMADSVVVDILWVLRKIAYGELIAAKHMIHRSLIETNLRLMRELRIRKELTVPSFGLGRHAEKLLSNDEQSYLKGDARFVASELREAALHTFKGLETLMERLEPLWRIPPEVRLLIARWSDPDSDSPERRRAMPW
jgi:hypothetical protein